MPDQLGAGPFLRRCRVLHKFVQVIWLLLQVRAKYMTLDPAANRYVKYIRNIRTIQDYLCRRADKHMIPKVDNTNVDRSVATIHATVLACLRHTSQVSQSPSPLLLFLLLLLLLLLFHLHVGQ